MRKSCNDIFVTSFTLSKTNSGLHRITFHVTDKCTCANLIESTLMIGHCMKYVGGHTHATLISDSRRERPRPTEYLQLDYRPVRTGRIQIIGGR